MRQTGWRFAVKRLADYSVAASALLLASPLIAATAVAVRVSMGRPVLFKQRRPGRDGRPFDILKFRTMRAASDAAGNPLPDEERMTRVGAFLRSTSLDELPQLVNVLRGDLSLVGPRPLLMRYLDRYSPEQARRHDVLPGITGWCQVNGRNDPPWIEKLALDVWYVDNWSLCLDARILLLTVGRVLKRSGVAREGHATTPEFMGSDYGEKTMP
jgi:lipopolysaccharide/colanic/teichoic acid biosynthesis glycosyltransferase